MTLQKKRPLVLIILDGWGINPSGEANAIDAAAPPFYASLLAKYPNTTLEASGESVGLPKGQMGNSEVGHLNIGAGRIVFQDLPRINRSITEGHFIKNAAFVAGIQSVKEQSGTLHLMILLSDGGVHSHINHLEALLEMAEEQGMNKLRIHIFLDGRDTPPKSAGLYIQQLERMMSEKNILGDDWKIASVSGRFFAMDRDQRWPRTEQAYEALVLGKGQHCKSAKEALEQSYADAVTDEFLVPAVVCDAKGEAVGRIRDGDAVFYLNFRADRARQMTQALTQKDFEGFKRSSTPALSAFVSMTSYSKAFSHAVAFEPTELSDILGEVLSQQGLKQLRIAETEKYAHVTYFFNGGREEPFPGEERILVPSPKEVTTYDQKPEMSAAEVTEKVLAQIEADRFDFICINFANPDMVGHSGILGAAIKAVDAIDGCLERIVKAVLAKQGLLMITADHGNLEQMTNYESGEPHTAHTTFPVPFILISDQQHKLKEGIHANIAPTILELMGISKPEKMDHDSLIVT